VSLANNVEFLRHLPKLNEIKNLGITRGVHGDASPLSETTGFGANPGDLRMFSFVPENPPKTPALVVVLHGCTQSASGYDIGTGWSALAERYGFALLMPEQKLSNNPNGCFNWFQPEDITRERGEAASIRQMIEQMVTSVGVDRKNIFITGLSAGGAMTSVMLATYPEVFKAGAIIAGLPYGIASNVQEALKGMFRSPPHPADALGDLVRKASTHKGPWPKLSVWHGSADRTVHPSNANEIVKQWLDVNHLPAAPMAETTVDGYPHRVWWNADGETIVESYTITNMAHGTPLGASEDDERYGIEGAFLLEAGISSSYHIANFFGLTKRLPQPKDIVLETVSETPKAIPGDTAHEALLVIPQETIRKETIRPISTATPPERPLDVTPVFKVRGKGERRAEPREQQRRAIDVGAVINRALTAAGLLKKRP
jgi:poly(hydroxyalkanoate) depolymerase family esterase